MKILNIIFLVGLAAFLAYGAKKFKALFSGFVGNSDRSEDDLAELIDTDVEPDSGRYDDDVFDKWVGIIINESETDSLPTEHKQSIVDWIASLEPAELKYLVLRFGLKDHKVSYGFFNQNVKSRTLMETLVLEYDQGLWGGLSGTASQREALTKAFGSIDITLNF